MTVCSALVSILNFRTPELTIRAAQSVLEDIGAHDVQVVIVDNDSGDGSAEKIKAWVDTQTGARVELIRSNTNSGFAGGHNLALSAYPNADGYILLNSDAYVRPGFLDAMAAAIAARPDAGLIAPRLEYEDGTAQQSCFRFASPVSELIRGAESAPVTRLFSDHVVALPVDPDPGDIEWASFACIYLRGAMVRALGPMDAGYFLYFEDEEYCLRAGRAGWLIAHDAAARAVHLRGKSGPVKSLQRAAGRLPKYYYRSRTRFFRQAHGRMGPLLANMAWVAGRLLAYVRPLTGRAVPAAYASEWRDIWTGFSAPLKPNRTKAQ